MTTPPHALSLWHTTPLPEGWCLAHPGCRQEALAAGLLTRRNMRHYWRARHARFSLTMFLRHWSQQHSLLWRPEQKKIRGVLSWTQQGEHAHLCELQLEKAYRGHGVGTSILTHWLLACYQQGVTRVDLKVFRDNPAYHLYTRCGFWALAVDVNIPGFITMRCSLDASRIKKLHHAQQSLCLSSSPLSA